MSCLFSELRCKEVIDLRSGQRLGYVCDAEFDPNDGKLLSLIVPGQGRAGGLLGREEDTVIPWEDIQVIGEDTILVRCPAIKKSARRRKR